jgi:hypothetical protein
MKAPAQKRDLYAGALLILMGLGAVIEGRTNSIGTLTDMGAGYFPIALGVALAGLGAVIALGSFSIGGVARDELGEALHPPDWRGCVAIVLGMLAFIVLGRFFGLAPAILTSAFISALGDRDSTLKSAAILALSLTIFAVVLFSYLLQLPFPVVKW